MKSLLLVSILFLTGCSTLGNMEALNDVGAEDAREAAHVFTTTREVLGIPVERNRAPVINRGYGHVQNMKTYPQSTGDVPFVIKGYIEAERYLRGILK